MIELSAAAIALHGAAPAREIGFTVPAGFAVERAATLDGSFLSIAFAADGSAYVGREGASIARCVDPDGDGRFAEDPGAISCGLVDVQGLWCEPGAAPALWAVGSLEGSSGVWRIPLADGREAGECRREFAFTAAGEHGPHALVPGPDGALYAVVGNQSAFSDAASHLEGFWRGDEGRLLRPYPDPLGFGTEVRYPGGFVARLDLRQRSWQFVTVGLRNVYDVAFDAHGALFGVDSDMEWDLGLPWYRPVRLLALVEGGDCGSRAGSGVIPAWCPDTLSCVLELERGSPTGAVFGTGTRFPERWRTALFSGDWAVGKILALWTGRDGSGLLPSRETFLSADGPLPVTDLEVAPDGSLWFLTGGRGTRGGLYRVTWEGEAQAAGAAGGLSNSRRATQRLEREARELAQGLLAPDPRESGAVIRQPWRDDWSVALRCLSARGLETGVAQTDLLASSENPGERLAALYLLSLPPRDPARVARLGELGLELLRWCEQEETPSAERLLGVLRGLELGLARQGNPEAGAAEALGAALLARFPHGDPRVSMQLALLLAHLDEPRALGPLLSGLESAPQEEAIHYADCAHRMTRGWDGERRQRLFSWFARSSVYSGGVSLPGYLSAMRASFVAGLSSVECDTLAQGPGLDAESLALLCSQLPPERARAHFPRLEALLARLVPRAFGTREQAQKDAALRTLAKLSLEEVPLLARRLADEQGDALEAPWEILARTPQSGDFELWLRALVSPSSTKRERALEALKRIPRRPSGAESWRSLLDHAHELGPRRGRELARMISRWTASTEPQSPEDPLETAESFERARLAAEAWYREAYPAGLPPMELDAAPRWTETEIAAFLERAAARPGDPDVGRAVFEAAGCAACHAVGSTPAGDRLGFGPDLAGVAERLSRAELLAAILAPSRVVSDQYRASIALTKDERLFEGFVTVRDADGIELRTQGGESVRIESDELESLGPSTRSPMPEGLLESRTLEEIRDLFAYLKEGRGSAGARVWAPLFGSSGLKGWDGDSAVWSLRGGLLSGRSQGLAQSSYALAPLPDRDLCVEFDVFLPPGANSGLAYRAQRRDRDPEPLADPSGFQADLGQSHWGSLYVDGRGTVAKPDPAALEAALDRRGWNHVLVRFRGEAHSMEINGLETYSAVVSAAEGALFGFQVHQGKPMQVRIANARWRRP